MLREGKHPKLVKIEAEFLSEGGGPTPYSFKEFFSCEDETKALKWVMERFHPRAIVKLKVEVLGKVIHL